MPKKPSGPPAQIGSLVRDFRLAAGITQAQLASEAGLSLGLVRDLEQGRTLSPRWSSMEALTLALGLAQQERARLTAALDHQPKRTHAADHKLSGTTGP